MSGKIFVIILGIFDLIAGAILFFNVSFSPEIITFISVILIVKGFTSLLADMLGKIYGVVDIVSGIVIFYGLAIGDFSIILAGILIYKGIFSLLAFFR